MFNESADPSLGDCCENHALVAYKSTRDDQPSGRSTSAPVNLNCILCCLLCHLGTCHLQERNRAISGLGMLDRSIPGLKSQHAPGQLLGHFLVCHVRHLVCDMLCEHAAHISSASCKPIHRLDAGSYRAMFATPLLGRSFEPTYFQQNH
jgi:hypothetical protein